jgi:hypothetical protein
MKPNRWFCMTILLISLCVINVGCNTSSSQSSSENKPVWNSITKFIDIIPSSQDYSNGKYTWGDVNKQFLELERERAGTLETLKDKPQL